MIFVYHANWLNSFILVLEVFDFFLDFLKCFLHRPITSSLIKTAWLLHFKSVCTLFLFLALLYCQELQVKCWTEAVRVDIYALFLMLWRNIYYFSLLNLMLTISFLEMSFIKPEQVSFNLLSFYYGFC